MAIELRCKKNTCGGKEYVVHFVNEHGDGSAAFHDGLKQDQLVSIIPQHPKSIKIKQVLG